MGFLKNKKALITGIAGERSIAWGIAQAMHREGADIALTYQNDKLHKRVQNLAEKCGCKIILPCDVAVEESIIDLFTALSKQWDELDILVHSIAFAPREALAGSFIDNTTRENFASAHEISSYSLTALARQAAPLMKKSAAASILTLSYLGAAKAVPHYNVMGLAKASLEANVRYLAMELGAANVRVNAISAGPIKTLAASGIAGFRTMLDHVAQNAPLKKNVSIEEVGNAAAFLASDLASGITGEILYVDAGFSIVGMPTTVIT